METSSKILYNTNVGYSTALDNQMYHGSTSLEYLEANLVSNWGYPTGGSDEGADIFSDGLYFIHCIYVRIPMLCNEIIISQSTYPWFLILL